MAGRRYKRVRIAGQDAPEYNAMLAMALGFGIDLFAGGHGSGITVPEGFDLDLDLAEQAWRAHRHLVLESWAEYWEQSGITPTPWAARVFDDEPQITTPLHDERTADHIRSIEATAAHDKNLYESR